MYQVQWWQVLILLGRILVPVPRSNGRSHPAKFTCDILLEHFRFYYLTHRKHRFLSEISVPSDYFNLVICDVNLKKAILRLMGKVDSRRPKDKDLAINYGILLRKIYCFTSFIPLVGPVHVRVAFRLFNLVESNFQSFTPEFRKNRLQPSTILVSHTLLPKLLTWLP